MDENMDIGIDDFFSAFEDGDGNHTEPSEGAETGEPNQEENEPTSSEAEERSESGADSNSENTNEPAEPAAEGEGEPQKAEEKHSFDNIKVNGEIHSVSYEDAPAWIQKGMDYDRVKGKLEEERQANAQLRQTVEQHQGTIDMLELISKDTDMKMEDLLHAIHKQVRMQKGETEKEAEANIRAVKAEREASAAKVQKEQLPAEQNSNQDRANREFAEFRAAHPDVQLDDKLVAALKPDITAGMSLLSAYQKMLNRQQAEQIAELQRQLAAEKQNNKNAVTSPGSQKDSGGQRQKDQYDDFFSAFDK